MNPTTTEEYKRLIKIDAQRFINEMDEPSNYKVTVTSCGSFKYMDISDEVRHTTIFEMRSYTYRSLYEAVRDAWALHRMAKRGF